jgi:hypothetical protein
MQTAIKVMSMSEEKNFRVEQWQPPVRPEWVQRINDEGRFLDIRGVVPLDEDSLIARARANTGLADFGGEDWREPFQIFVKSLDEEAGLTLMGRILTRSDLLMYLEARLRIQDTFKRHPEIDDQELAPPMMIVGSGRSGTSAIQNLLSFDPDNGTPKHWEALFPCPPPEAATYQTDPRIPLADQRMTQWNRVTPEMASIHEFGGDMPTELIQLEAMSFQAGGWLIFCGFTPSYSAYMDARSGVPGLQYAKKVLKLLQWKNPRHRWLLKSPDSMRYLPDVFKVFPNMQLIWMHRDPIKSVSSAVSLVGTILWTRSDQKMDSRAIAQLTNPAGLAGLFNRVMDQIDRGEVPAAQMHSVQYLELVDSPMETVEKLYRDMGIPLTTLARTAMQRYLREHPRESRPPHRYAVGGSEQQNEERKLFDRYVKRYQVKSEL